VKRAALALAVLLHAPARAADAPAPPKDPPGVVHMTAEQQQVIKLKLVTAEREPITQPIHLPGSVTFDPGHVAILRPFGQARLVRLLVQPGAVVAAGQVVAELEFPSLAASQQQLAAARATVHEAETGVAVAANALRRGEILAREGSLAYAEADRRRLVLAQARAALEAAKSRVTALEAQVARLDPLPGIGLAGLKSPIDGIVVSASVTPGEVLSEGAEALTVADLSTVLVLAQVPEGSAAQVAVDDPVQVSLAGGNGRHWDGHIDTLAAALDVQARTLPARIVLANPDLTLRAGMYVDVLVTRELNRQSVVVPSAAVQLIGDKRVVFTPAGGDRFQSHDVEVGVQSPDSVEIRRGILAGQSVVAHGSFELKALLQKSMLGGG